jgi:hypothetical protein
VQALAHEQATSGANVQVEVDTFAHWARLELGDPDVSNDRDSIIAGLLDKHRINLPISFVLGEIEYILGRFPAASLNGYINTDRTGRGLLPRLDKPLRQRFLDLITDYKSAMGNQFDWDDISILMASQKSIEYDIVIIDEAQDFSANQIRAVLHHVGANGALTLVIDTVQRLYPRGYTWAEVGIDVRKARMHRLTQNHRNTIEIARFAKGIISGLAIDDDGTLPDLNGAKRHGSLPVVVRGKFSEQLKYALDYIEEKIDLSTESLAFLHPKGGGWFDATRAGLARRRIGFVEIARLKSWPSGPENVALSTMHSAKGLEFDHVVILGLNSDVTQHDVDPDDHDSNTLRRLLAMAVARARNTVLLGYKPSEASGLVKYFEVGSFKEEDL